MERKPRTSNRKKINQIKKEIHDPDEQQTDSATDKNQKWTATENLNFVNSVTSQFQNAPYKSYKDSMGQIDWNMVNMGRSEHECRSHLNEIIKPIKKFRTLNEILTEFKHQIPGASVSGVNEMDDSDDSEPNSRKNKPKPAVKSKKKGNATGATVTATSSQQSADIRFVTAECCIELQPEPQTKPKPRATVKSKKKTIAATAAATTTTAISDQESPDVRCLTVEPKPEMSKNGGRKRKLQTNGKTISVKKQAQKVCGFSIYNMESDDSDE